MAKKKKQTVKKLQQQKDGKKYEFTGKVSKIFLQEVYQIRRFSDGKIGGWIQSEENLSHEGSCWVADNAFVLEEAKVYDDAQVSDDVVVFDSAQVFGNANISGNAQVYGAAKIHGNAQLSGYVEVFSRAQVYGNAYLCDHVFVGDEAQAYGEASLFSSANVEEDVCVYSKMLYVLESELPKHLVFLYDEHIVIGCASNPIEYWLENFKELGLHHNYSLDEINLYYTKIVKILRDHKKYQKYWEAINESFLNKKG